MNLSNIIRTGKTYLLAGLLVTAHTAEGLAHNKKAASVLKEAGHNIKAGEKLHGLKKDTYVTTHEAYHLKNQKIKLDNGTTTTTDRLQQTANIIAKSDKRPIKRPSPVVDKNKKITSFVKVYSPKSKSGPLKGKVVIINAGHGGYNKKNGLFDPGTYAVDSKGKKVEEWSKNQSFAKEIIPKLTKKGAKVIYTDGTAKTIMETKKKYSYADAFISFHCNAANGNSKIHGQTIIYKDELDKQLAKSVENKLYKKNLAKSDVRRLGVLRSTSKMPSILIETGYETNPKDLKNIDSKSYREKFTNSVANGIEEFLKHNKKK